MKRSILILFIISLFFNSCKKNEDQPPVIEPEIIEYQIPEAIVGDWEIAHLEDVGMKQTTIESMMKQSKTYQHSILIVKNNKLVYEEYFKGSNNPWNIPWDVPSNEIERNIEYTIETLHYQASATKSVVSALIGICLDQGIIDNVEQKISDFFPEYEDLFIDSKSTISLKNILTMQSGILWDGDDTYNMDQNNDKWVEYVLNKPMECNPGTKYQYNDGLSVLLAEIVRSVSQLPADKFAEQYLFGPLGISDYYWMKSNTGEIAGGWGLYLRPRDMAKFGLLFQQKGKWNGQTIISESWVNESTSRYVYVDYNVKYYAYQWWLFGFNVNGKNYETYAALGAGGQQIYIIEELDLIVVFTAGDDSVFGRNERLLSQYIIPACLN